MRGSYDTDALSKSTKPIYEQIASGLENTNRVLHSEAMGMGTDASVSLRRIKLFDYRRFEITTQKIGNDFGTVVFPEAKVLDGGVVADEHIYFGNLDSKLKQLHEERIPVLSFIFAVHAPKDIINQLPQVAFIDEENIKEQMHVIETARSITDYILKERRKTL
jgi:hypothetical protein